MTISAFISSTSLDLKEHRKAVDDALRGLEIRPINMRDFGSQPGGAVEVSLREVAKADLFIGIIANRYGHVPEGMNLSVTEQEYNEAVHLNKPRLMYLIDPSHELTWEGQNDESNRESSETTAKLEAFQKRVEKKDVRSFFTTPDDLRARVTSDVTKWREHKFQRQTLWRMLYLATTVLVLAGALHIWNTSRIPPIEPGAFNVAIAGFVADPESTVTQADARRLSEGFFRSFEAQIESLQGELSLAVGVFSPIQVGLIEGRTPEERDQNAENKIGNFRTDREITIDIIVYGIITTQEDQFSRAPIVVVSPEFYVAAPNPEISDLLGRFQLEAAIASPSTDVLSALSSELSERSRVLSFITQGLVLSIVNPPQYDNAYNVFSQALNARNSAEPGTELVRILMGNSLLGLYNQTSNVGGTDPDRDRLSLLLEQSRSEFMAAQQANSQFSRAYIGIASSAYLALIEQSQVTGNWNDIAIEDIEDIEALYQTALRAQDQPESADVSTKVSFGMGQLATLRYLRGQREYWDSAEAYFQSVINDFGEGQNIRVRELAAQAYGYIATLHNQINEYDLAEIYFEEAIRLTYLESRRQLFVRSLLLAKFERNRTLGDLDAALDAAENMLSLPMLPRDRATIMYHAGRMLSENNSDQEALDYFQRGVAEIDDGVRPVTFVSDPFLAAQLWSASGDKLVELSRVTQAIEAYERAVELEPNYYNHLIRVVEELAAVSPTP